MPKNLRVWILGDLDKKIIPSKSVVDDLARSITKLDNESEFTWVNECPLKVYKFNIENKKIVYTLGSYTHKIVPSEKAINTLEKKLRDALALQAEVVDIIWDDTLRIEVI